MRYLISLAALLCLQTLAAQNNRSNDYNNLIWTQVFTTTRLNDKAEFLLEYQLRRTNGLADWQQSLLRTGIQYRLNDAVSIAAGYGWIETYPYGEFPLAAQGTFPEHRIHEQIQVKHAFGKLTTTQRLRVEQRFIGSMQNNGLDKWLFSHRFRHMLRLQYPVSSFHLAATDEVFIGAGKNVGANIFDQNRIMLVVGKRLSPSVVLEAGYINQTLMQGRRINDRVIVQRNNGLLLTGSFLL